MTPTEAEVEAFARKLAAEAGWERYVDTARRTLEAAPTDASMTDTLPAEAIEAAATALYGHWGARPGYLGDQYREEKARAALLAALPHIRGAEDHYFAVDYTGCIHEAPDKETAIKWAEDFARTANGGAIGSERRDVAAMLADAEARVAPSPTSVPGSQAMSDVKDLIERLRDYHAHDMSDELAAAADALERLSAERDEARKALRRIASRNVVYLTNSGSDNPAEDAARSLYREWKAIMEIARAALKAEPVEP